MEKVLNSAGVKLLAFLFREIFRVALADTGLKASVLARELGRERTLIYKWLSGTCVPDAAYFPLIADVVDKYSSQAHRLILFNDLQRLVSAAGLSRELKETLFSAGSARELLAECFSLCALSKKGALRDEVLLPGRDLPFGVLFWALFVSLAGGILWSVLNRIVGWSYYMGTADDALRGPAAFLWGAATIAPLSLSFFMIPGSKLRVPRMIGAFLYTLAGALSGLLYFTLAPREFVESSGLGYAY